MKASFPIRFMITTVAGCAANHADAEKTPQSLGDLKNTDFIIVGDVVDIRIESGPS